MIIYGYFNSNLGDDLLVKNFLNKMKGSSYTFLFFNNEEKVNIKLMCSRNNLEPNMISHKQVGSLRGEELFYIGGSTIRNPFTNIYFFIYFNRMYIYFLKINKKCVKINYVNTNLEKNNFFYRIFLRYFLKNVDKILVRDYKSYKLASDYVKNTYLIRDLVDIPIDNDKNEYCCVNVIPKFLKNINYCKMIETFMERNKGRIYFVEFEKNEYSDEKFINFFERINVKNLDVEIIYFTNIETTLTIVQNARLNFATRFHMYMIAKNACNLDTAVVYDNKIIQYEETFFSNSNLKTINGKNLKIKKIELLPIVAEIECIFI